MPRYGERRDILRVKVATFVGKKWIRISQVGSATLFENYTFLRFGVQEEREISRMKVVPKPGSKIDNDNGGIPDQVCEISGVEIHLL